MKKRILIIISALIAAVICAGFFVLMTESGLRWTFRQLSYAVSGLSARSIKGRLAGPLQIQGLLYKEPELSLELNSLNLNWDPLKLLTLKLHLTELDIEGVKIITSANETSAQTEFLPGDLHLPVAIEIGNATIKNILISDQDQQPFLIDSAVLSTSVNALSAEVHVLKIASPLFTASIKGDISLSENLPLDMFLEWEVYPEGLAAVKGKGRIAGSLKEFKIEQETSAPFRANLKGTVQNITQDIQWEASVTLAELLTGRVNAEWPDIHLTAGLQIEGTASKADIKGTFNARDSLYFGELSGYVDTAIDGGHISIKKIKISIPASNAGLEINGEYDLSNKASPLRIAADWNSLVWPVMTKEGRISSKKGSILLSGTPDKYDFQVNAFFNPENILESEWTLSGQGTDSGISVETFTAELLKGSLKGRGEIHWNPVMDWTIAFNGSHLNPGVIAKEWEGDISVDATASGSVDKGLTKMQVDLQRLEGRLRGHPLRGVIQADISGDTYTVKQFDIQSGSARLTAAGTLGKTSDIKWKIKAPDLGDLYPGGKGSIHGEGMIKGRSNAPEITVELAGKGIAAGAFKGEEIGIRASVNLDKDGESKLDLRAGKVLINNQGIDLLSLVVSGETAEHLITLNVISGKRDLSLRLKGSYLESIWKAQLLQTDLAAADFGQWSLRVPVDLYISADKAESGNLCLINAGSKVCMQSAWKKDAEIEGMFFLSRFPLPLLKTFFIIETELDGMLDGEAHIA
ncbi:hypothetical protein H8E50_02675, partial [bacterium]|nr:hypothetical protein [bacterium]